jgi:thiosulfate/3-mercaptopyruvate sulfurtransferase
MLRSCLITLTLLIAALTPASAQGPLVDVAWLKTNLGKPGLVILDVRSGAGRTVADYLAEHVPGAVFTDYAKDGWREKNAAGVEGMLPPPDKVERLIGSLGIDNTTHVVLVPEGRAAVDVAAATRLYWTFKVMGHDLVSVLDGGHAAWTTPAGADKKPVNPLEQTAVKPQPKTFKANVRHAWIIGKAEVETAAAAKQPLIDNRPPDFYMGLTKSPVAKTAGTIPGATSIPESWLTENNGGRFRSKDQLAKIYAATGVPTTGRQVNFCNTGHWASLGWFVAHEILGNKEAVMYDGSMAEWTQDAKAPVEVKIKLQ